MTDAGADGNLYAAFEPVFRANAAKTLFRTEAGQQIS